MRHLPIFLDSLDQRILVAGAGETAVAKLRILLKSEAHLAVFGTHPHAQILAWASSGQLELHERALKPEDLSGARLLYAAHDEAEKDAEVAALGRRAGLLVNLVDQLEASDFLTPALVDRTPLTVAIGTEGAAPVLARRVKADLEKRLAHDLGLLARAGQAFRPQAEALPQGPRRRAFWSDYYDSKGPRVLAEQGEAALPAALADLLLAHLQAETQQGAYHVIATGPGAPDLLTLRAQNLLHEADLVVHDSDLPSSILELARREAPRRVLGLDPTRGQTPLRQVLHEAQQAVAQGQQVVRLLRGALGQHPGLAGERHQLDALTLPYTELDGLPDPALSTHKVDAPLQPWHAALGVPFKTLEEARV